MCLACDLDALWYAEWERLAVEGAGAPGAAGVLRAASEEQDDVESGKAAGSRFRCEQAE